MLATTKIGIAKTDTRNKEVVMQWLANENANENSIVSQFFT